MKVCPKCGAIQVENLVIDVISFQCGSNLMLDGLERSQICYETQLTQQANQIATLELSLKSLQEHHEAQTKDWKGKVARQVDLLRQTLEVVIWAANHRCLTNPPGMISNQSHKAQALILDLEKVLDK